MDLPRLLPPRTLPVLTARLAGRRVPLRKRTPWAWAASGALLGLLAGALVFAPAKALAAALVWAGSPVRLHNTEGTLWNGSGQLEFRTDALGSTALAGRLAWTLRPIWLNGQPGLHARWQADCCMSGPWSWRISTDLQSVQLEADDLLPSQPLRVPAAILTGLGTPWNTLQPQGRLELSTRALRVHAGATGMRLQGALQLDALAVSTSLSTLRPVGSYRLALQGADNPVLTLSTLDGALQLRGNGSIRKHRLVFSGEATAAEGREDALSNLLNIIGQRQGARSLIQLG